MKLKITPRLVVCLATCACPSLLLSGCGPAKKEVVEKAAVVAKDILVEFTGHAEKDAAIKAGEKVQEVLENRGPSPGRNSREANKEAAKQLERLKPPA